MLKYITPLPSALWQETFPRTLTLLGSTGSIGVSTLKVIARHPEMFQVIALAGGRNTALLAEQARVLRPQWLAVQDANAAQDLATCLPRDYAPRVLYGPEGYARLASLENVSTVLSAQVGAAGLAGTVAAARAGKVICLANKESLVLAGTLLRDLCRASGATILPVDSEHNAVFQAMTGRESAVRTVVLTASGGPFRGKNPDSLRTVTRAQALQHPSWNMGAKITIDSATMMNKGLEVIEAHHLYTVPSENIRVVVHPQSLVHSLVQLEDGSLIGQLGTPDMRLAIAHCLHWPVSMDCGVVPLDLAKAHALTFEEPDLFSFPCLQLAKEALHQGQGSCVTLNAANEVAVDAFLHDRIGFMDIPALIQRALRTHSYPKPDTLADIEAIDRETRRFVGEWIPN